jgi:hypothetical protein
MQKAKLPHKTRSRMVPTMMESGASGARRMPGGSVVVGAGVGLAVGVPMLMTPAGAAGAAAAASAVASVSTVTIANYQ